MEKLSKQSVSQLRCSPIAPWLACMSLCMVGPLFAAQPNFDAGALLEQLNRQSVAKPTTSVLPADSQPRELLLHFEFRELPEHLVPVATDFLKPYIGKEVRINGLLMALYAHLQSRNSRDNFVFAAKKLATGYVFIAQKVMYDGLTIESNATRSSDEFLAGIMGYALTPQTPLDYAQIERNASVANELPGMVTQFNMKPGSVPGSSNVHLSTDQGPFYGGSASIDNSSTRSLGQLAARTDVAAYNHFGRGDIIRLNGQLTRHSQSAGVDATAIVHPSGLRAGVNLSTFRYGYRTETDGTAAGNPQHSDSHYTGVSNSAGLNFSYPSIRSDEARQNLTLDLNQNATVSDVDIAQQTTILGTNPLQVNNSSADYRLSDLKIRKAVMGVNGAQALATGATVNYQLTAVVGHAQQRIDSAAAQDSTGELTLGGFSKVNLALQFSQGFALAGRNFDGLLATELQLTHRNLAGPEKAYLGGMFKMQAWGPQAVGGAQMAYVKAQITSPIASVPGMAVGAFNEMALVQISHRNYNATLGSQSVPVDSGWQTISDVGVMATHSPLPNLSLTASIAAKLSQDPFVNGSRIPADGRARVWVGARLSF